MTLAWCAWSKTRSTPVDQSSTVDGSEIATTNAGVVLKDGTQVALGGACQGDGDARASCVSSIKDPNGNFVTIQQDLTNHIDTWTDATGRIAMKVYFTAAPYSQPGPGHHTLVPTTIQTFDSAGHPQTWTLTWASQSVNFKYSNPSAGNCSSDIQCGANGDVGGTINALTRVTLPDGTFYSFGYDPGYGVVNSITLPTGGSVSFTWAINSMSDVGWFAGSSSASGFYPNPMDGLAVSRQTINDGRSTAQWSYSYTTSPYNGGDWTSKTTTVTDPQG